ncbi:MAG: leucine-rich repeat domain-containing protein, partial [Clostridia bacterium]|nr:leucine-rich repeat domain-containing protein [Clostridia bacterium]
MKKHVSIIIVLLAFVYLLASCYGDGTHTHSFGEWETAKEPTCTEDGEKVRYCACGEEQIKPIYAGGHTEIVDEAVEATCTEAGLTDGKHCSVCSEVIVAQTVVAAKGHAEVVDVAIEPTCTTTGKTEGKHCSTCNEVLIAQTEVPKASHTYDDQYDESCNVCGFVRDAECAHTEVTILPAKDATCTESGLTEGKVCVKCEEILAAQTIIDAKGHTEVIDEAVEPTCTETGLTEGKHCSVCSEVLVDQTTLDANGHSFENRLCTVCGEWDYSKGLEFVSNGEGTCCVKSIGDCEDAEIIIPHYSPDNEKVTSIYGRAFSDCRSLTSVIIPETVTVIGSYAFSGCLSLDNVVLPEGLTEIGRYAFQYCWSLESITIPDGITMLEGAMFFDCKSLAKINI